MSNNKLTGIVQDIYAAFLKNDVPSILEKMSENVTWDDNWTGYGIPWLMPQKGRAGVATFFKEVGEHLQFEEFNVKNVLEGPNVVVALIDLKAKVTKTGKTLKERDEAHIWRFDDKGRIVSFQHGADTLGHLMTLL